MGAEELPEEKMSLLEKAIGMALRGHAGQEGKDGSAYVLHPPRVMGRMESDEERMAAVLHDVVEDSEVTLEELRAMGFPERVVEVVGLLTHEPGVDYEEYVRRLAGDAMARRIRAVQQMLWPPLCCGEGRCAWFQAWPVCANTGAALEAHAHRPPALPNQWPQHLLKCSMLADLEDNSDIRRLSGIEDRDIERLRKYHRAWQILRAGGDASL